MKKSIIVLILIISMISFIFPTGINSRFAAGNEYYENGEYQKALDVYLKIAEKTSNWKLFYNIGNSYFKTGDIVRSKINYLKAERLKPFNKSIEQNLRIIDGLLNNRVRLPEPDFLTKTLMKFESFLAINVLSVLILIILFIFSFFTFRLVRAGRSKNYIYGILISFILLLFLFFYHIHRVNNFYRNKHAVIVIPNSQLRSGPGEENTILFEINPGVTIRVIDVHRDWVQVAASTDIAGWIERKNIEKISLQ
ncbi:MAG: SH3 domain-containing protein [Candidatus Aminicenantes bacterium]|nr:SH3 domain-containing protein [Candidatus Aminicenantes bacterium]